MKKFTLEIDGTVYDDVTEDFLKDSIKAMPGKEPGGDNFLILDPKEPVQNSIYLQTLYENGVFYVETRIVHSDNSFTHYSYETFSQEETEKLFTEYYLYQKLPNITEWEDVTDTM